MGYFYVYTVRAYHTPEGSVHEYDSAPQRGLIPDHLPHLAILHILEGSYHNISDAPKVG